MFPPDVGGSATLFHDVYSRIEGQVTVLTHARPGHVDRAVNGLRILRMPMGAPSWGVLHPGSLRRYSRVAFRLGQESRRTTAIVHCGRALPEGLAAAVSRMCGGPRFLCWALGEELDYARTSRELTLLQAQVYGHASRVIAISRNTARKLQDVGVARSKIALVHPGVDVKRFAQHREARALRRRLAPRNELLLLTVGRLERRKGHARVIRALAALNRSSSELRYVIVGEGAEQDRLRQLAADTGVADRVLFIGAVSAELLPAYYTAADIFVHPNRVEEGEEEGFGIVFLEAAAAGLPVVGGNNGGVPDALEAGTTGLLVDGRDAAAVTAALEPLIESELLRRRMGEAGRARVRGQFTLEHAARKVADIHQELGRSA